MYRLITANRTYSSWSLRPWVLMKALAIPFEDERVEFAGLDNYTAFRRFSPSATVPCLIDGERTVWDSMGIALYLADRHAGIWPAEAEAKAWAQCVAAEMHSGFSLLRQHCTMAVGLRVRLNEIGPALARDVTRVGEILTHGLERFGGPWLAGPAFTAADAFFAPIAYRIRTYDLDVGAAGRGWVQRMIDHPAMREWEKASLAEPYREVEHEAEIALLGTIVADHRALAQ